MTFFLVAKPLISSWKSSALMKLSYIFWSKVCSSPGKKNGRRKCINILFMKQRFHSSISLSMSCSPSMPTFVCCMALLFHASDGEYLGFTLFYMSFLFTVSDFSSWVAWEQENFSFHYPLLQMKDRLSYCVWSPCDCKMLLSQNLLTLSDVNILLSFFSVVFLKYFLLHILWVYTKPAQNIIFWLVVCFCIENDIFKITQFKHRNT